LQNGVPFGQIGAVGEIHFHVCHPRALLSHSTQQAAGSWAASAQLGRKLQQGGGGAEGDCGGNIRWGDDVARNTGHSSLTGS
jgi:hypothetical protein